jgi:O-antigen/teichoic acid export membrane protein
MASRGVLSMVGLAAQGVLRLLTSLLVGRFGGPSLLGVVQTAISAATFLCLVWPTTTGSAASKFVARARGAGRVDEALSVAAHLRRRTTQATVVLGLAAVPIWTLAIGGDLAGGLCVGALVVGYGGYNFARGLQFGVGQVRRATVWDVIIMLAGLLTLLMALMSGVRGPVLVLPMAAAYLLYTLAGWPWRTGQKPDRRLRRELDGFVALGVAGTTASAGFLQLSMVVAKLVGSGEEAGQYAAALTLATPASLLAGSLSLVLFPAMAEAWGRGDVTSFRWQTDQATRLLVVVMVAMFGALALCSRLIVAVIWGGSYAEAGRLLPLMLFAVLPTTLAMASVNSLSTRSQKGMAATSAASLSGLAVGLVAWLLLATRYGEVGVAVGYLCGTVVIAGLPIALVWRRDGHQWGALAARLGVGVVWALVLMAAQDALGLGPWLDPAWAALFVAGWLALARRETKVVLSLLMPLLGRRGRPGADAAG